MAWIDLALLAALALAIAAALFVAYRLQRVAALRPHLALASERLHEAASAAAAQAATLAEISRRAEQLLAEAEQARARLHALVLDGEFSAAALDERLARFDRLPPRRRAAPPAPCA